MLQSTPSCLLTDDQYDTVDDGNLISIFKCLYTNIQNNTLYKIITLSVVIIFVSLDGHCDEQFPS